MLGYHDVDGPTESNDYVIEQALMFMEAYDRAHLYYGCQNARAGARVVLTLPSIYARSGLGRPKATEGPHYLGTYSTLEGQGRAQVLKTIKSFFRFLPYLATKHIVSTEHYLFNFS